MSRRTFVCGVVKKLVFTCSPKDPTLCGLPVLLSENEVSMDLCDASLIDWESSWVVEFESSMFDSSSGLSSRCGVSDS